MPSLEICLMTRARFEQGIHPDPLENGVIAITPTTGREDLRMYRVCSEPRKPANRKKYVFVIIPTSSSHWEDAIEKIRESAFAESCDFSIAEVVKHERKELVFTHDSHEESFWHLRQIGNVEVKGRR